MKIQAKSNACVKAVLWEADKLGDFQIFYVTAYLWIFIQQTYST